MEQTQFCSKCFQSLPLSAFSTRRDFIKTLNTYQIHYNKVCKVCTSARKKLWRASHPGYFKAYNQGHESDPITKVCLNCGIEYKTNNPLQKYCATDCRKKSRETEYKAWRLRFPGVNKEVFRRLILDRQRHEKRNYQSIRQGEGGSRNSEVPH
jgi:hypothetical protein